MYVSLLGSLLRSLDKSKIAAVYNGLIKVKLQRDLPLFRGCLTHPLCFQAVRRKVRESAVT